MQKYLIVPNTIHREFYAYTTHTTNQCRAFDALADMLDQKTFGVNHNPQELGRGQGGGAKGDYSGGINGHRQISPRSTWIWNKTGQNIPLSLYLTIELNWK
jgi:hypothetical protein